MTYTRFVFWFVKELKNAQSRNRTSDTRIFSPLLYQLSYLGIDGDNYHGFYIIILGGGMQEIFWIFWKKRKLGVTVHGVNSNN